MLEKEKSENKHILYCNYISAHAFIKYEKIYVTATFYTEKRKLLNSLGADIIKNNKINKNSKQRTIKNINIIFKSILTAKENPSKEGFHFLKLLTYKILKRKWH